MALELQSLPSGEMGWVDVPDTGAGTAPVPTYSGAGDWSRYFTAPNQFTNRAMYGPTGSVGAMLQEWAKQAGLPKDFDFNQYAAQVSPGYGWALPGASGWLTGANEEQIAQNIARATGIPSLIQVASQRPSQAIQAGAIAGQQRDIALQRESAGQKGFLSEIAPIAMIAMQFIPGLNIAANIGSALGIADATLAAAAGNAIMSGGMSAIGGGSPEEILKAAATGGATGAVGQAVGSEVGGGVLGRGLTGAATGATGAALTGQDITKGAAIGGLAGAGGEAIRQATATSPKYVGPEMGDIGSPAFPLPQPEGVVPGQVEPGQEVYDPKTGQQLTPEQVAAKYPSLYPGGVLPLEGQSTVYSPDTGIRGTSGLLAKALNLGFGTTPSKTYSLGGGPIPGGAAGGPTTVSVGAQQPAATVPSTAVGGGELESPATGGKRRKVWNISSLRNLQDELGT